MNTNDDFQEVRRDVDDLEAPAGDDPEARVEQLTSEIDETRDDLTETIQAIGDKLEPSNIAREASDTVRQATLGKVEQMTYGAQETWRDVRTGNTGSIIDTITSNPIPSGMVALGLGLLFMNRGASAGRDTGSRNFEYGRRREGRASWDPEEWAGQPRGDSPMSRLGSTVSGAAGQAGDTVGRAADQAGQAVSGVVDTVAQTAGDIPQQAGYAVQQGTSQARRFLDENPLGAGVIALAAGAALGMLLPTTRVERQTIGQARDQFVEQAESTVHQALDRVEQQSTSGGEGSSGYDTAQA